MERLRSTWLLNQTLKKPTHAATKNHGLHHLFHAIFLSVGRTRLAIAAGILACFSHGMDPEGKSFSSSSESDTTWKAGNGDVRRRLRRVLSGVLVDHSASPFVVLSGSTPTPCNLYSPHKSRGKTRHAGKKRCAMQGKRRAMENAKRKRATKKSHGKKETRNKKRLGSHACRRQE
jgi:hypothetical protein